MPQNTLCQLFDKISEECKIDEFSIYKERNFMNELKSSQSKTISQNNLKHGDMLYVKKLSEASSSSVRIFKYLKVFIYLFYKCFLIEYFTKTINIIRDSIEI